MLYGDQGKCSTPNFSVDDLQLPHNRGVGDFKLSLKYADEYLSILRTDNVSSTFGFILRRFTDKDCLIPTCRQQQSIP